MRISSFLPRGRCAAALAIGAVFLTISSSAPAATLVHRYDFTDDGSGWNVVDLVGGSEWNGTLPAGGDFITTPGQLAVSVDFGQWVQFPSGIISNYTALTIDAWATIGPNWGFLWSFGNTRPEDGAGGNALWLHVGDARATITDTMPSWGGEQNARFASLIDRGYVHVTVVIDPPNQRMLAYTNGVLASANYAMTRSLTNVHDINNYIGRSVFEVDGIISVTIDEFRIWNGALTGLEVAGCDVAGPDTIGDASDVGTVTNLVLQVPFPSTVEGGQQLVSVMAQATLFTNLMSIDNASCTFSSDNTNVVTVNALGRITAVAPGTANVTAQYETASSSIQITVFQEPAVLVHRYSFDEEDGSTTVADSIGGEAWNGTLPAGGIFADGQLSLEGDFAQYVELATNYFANMTNVTFESWSSHPPDLPWNSWFFGFGDIVNNDHGAYYFFVQPQSGRWVMAGLDPGWQGEQAATSGLNFSGQTNLHLVCVANTIGGYLAVYTNGVLAARNGSLSYPMSSIRNNFSFINRSLYPPDPYVDLSIDEFRIYNGALTPEQVAMNFQLGPAVLVAPAPPTLSAALADGSLVLSWSTNFPAASLEFRDVLGNGGTWADAGMTPAISGAQYQVTVPATNSARFFRLSE